MSESTNEPRDIYKELMTTIKACPTCRYCSHSTGIGNGLACDRFGITLVPHVRMVERTVSNRNEEFLRQQAASCAHYIPEPGARP